MHSDFKERELKVLTFRESLDNFHKYCRRLRGRYVHGAGTDRYYQHPEFRDELPVVRHRFSDTYSELTVKTATGLGNSCRNEVNLRLESGTREVEALLRLQGYDVALEISKISHIYYTPWVVFSFYAVMDPAGEVYHFYDPSYTDIPVGARFIEVELSEDVDWEAVWQDALRWEDTHNSYRGTFMFDLISVVRSTPLIADRETFCYGLLELLLTDMRANGVAFVKKPITKSLWDLYGGK